MAVQSALQDSGTLGEISTYWRQTRLSLSDHYRYRDCDNDVDRHHDRDDDVDRYRDLRVGHLRVLVIMIVSVIAMMMSIVIVMEMVI